MVSKNTKFNSTGAGKSSAQAATSGTGVVSQPLTKAPVAVAAAAPVVAPVAAPAAAAAAPASGAPRSIERDRTTVLALIAKLRDHDAEVARDAAATLGRLPADAQAVEALGEVLRNVDGYFHCVVRAAAAAALGSLGDRRAVDALIAATRDTMAEASEEAVRALGTLGDRRALPALEQIVRNEKGFYLENVRKSAQEAIGRITR